MLPRNLKDSYLALSSSVSLKNLESKYLYDTRSDELYELNDEAFEFLSGLDGSHKIGDLRFDEDFLEYCLEEGLVEASENTRNKSVVIGSQSGVSLRYLLETITTRCNLRCRHCYVGDTDGQDLGVETFKRIADEFDEAGGLRLLVSGGEPTMHPDFDEINRVLNGRSFRRVLLCNGTKLNSIDLTRLAFDEIQVSLDGLAYGHDRLRGEGAFDAAVAGIEFARQAGFQVSIATIIHRDNIDEMFLLRELVRDVEAISWTIDYPSKAGRLLDNIDLLADFGRLKEIMGLQFGAEVHESSPGLTCGSHLAALTPDGDLIKCGFYESWSGGSVNKGLLNAWQSLENIRLEELDCDCQFLSDCRGGCRFRAESFNGSKYAPDPVKCKLFLNTAVWSLLDSKVKEGGRVVKIKKIVKTTSSVCKCSKSC